MNTGSKGVNLSMDETIHQPGKLDFLIEEKDVCVTEFRRRPSAVWAYLETVGHVVFFTRCGKRDCVIMSIETHACMSGDYEKTMREVEEAAAAWREEQKAKRKDLLFLFRAAAYPQPIRSRTYEKYKYILLLHLKDLILQPFLETVAWLAACNPFFLLFVVG